MSITKGLENKIRRLIDASKDHNDIMFNWRGEAYRASFITNTSEDLSVGYSGVKVFIQYDEMNTETSAE